MHAICSVENGASPLDGFLRQTVMHHCRREESQPGVAVLVVVPGEEFLRKRTSILKGSEVFREARSIYFRVRKWLSEYGLSSETCGRL